MLALRHGLDEHLAEQLNGGLRENRTLVAQKIVRVNLVVQNQLNTLEVARTKQQRLGQLLATLNNERRARHVELVKRCAIELRLRILEFERINDRQLAIGELRSQRGAQCTEKLLLREGVIVAARLRAVNRVAVAPERRANRTDTRAARALLLPKLLARTSNFGTALGLVCALAQRGAVVLDRLPKEALVHLLGGKY